MARADHMHVLHGLKTDAKGNKLMYISGTTSLQGHLRAHTFTEQGTTKLSMQMHNGLYGPQPSKDCRFDMALDHLESEELRI